MRISTKLVAVLCAVTAATWDLHTAAHAGDDAGIRQMTAFSDERGRDLDLTVWYPAAPGGMPVVNGESVFFRGTPGMRDAPVAEGRFPLVVFSHGAGLAGDAHAMSWIAAPLAAQGFIVAAPTHPRNTGANRSAAETMKLWRRPADITATLDAIKDDTALQEHIDGGGRRRARAFDGWDDGAVDRRSPHRPRTPGGILRHGRAQPVAVRVGQAQRRRPSRDGYDARRPRRRSFARQVRHGDRPGTRRRLRLRQLFTDRDSGRSGQPRPARDNPADRSGCEGRGRHPSRHVFHDR